MRREYDTAIVAGRFAIVHNGHESLFNTGLAMAKRLLILVGSAQEVGTERNPFDVYTRIKMIKEIYPDDNVIVRPLSDLTHEDDLTPDWGKFVLDNIKHHIYKLPDLMVYGNDEARSKWFDPEDIKDITEVIVSRSRNKISGTEMRELMVQDNREEWFKHHNPMIHEYYDMLRGQLMSVDYYKRQG